MDNELMPAGFMVSVFATKLLNEFVAKGYWFTNVFERGAQRHKEFEEKDCHTIKDVFGCIADIKRIEMEGVANYHTQIHEFIGHDIKVGEIVYIVAALELLKRNYTDSLVKLGLKEKFNSLIADCEKYLTTISIMNKTGGGTV